MKFTALIALQILLSAKLAYGQLETIPALPDTITVAGVLELTPPIAQLTADEVDALPETYVELFCPLVTIVNGVTTIPQALINSLTTAGFTGAALTAIETRILGLNCTSVSQKSSDQVPQQ